MVVGLKLSVAKEVITSAVVGPQIDVQFVSGPTPPGSVFAQEPVPWSLVMPGSEIRLTVSNKPSIDDT
jgi:beta-lactam-binding protein with PASTA domain